MALPQGIQRVNFLSPSAPSDGIIHSIAQKGGYQEMITVGERNSIPLFENGVSTYTGFTISDDIWSSGRRRVGMMIHVVEDKKIFNLIRLLRDLKQNQKCLFQIAFLQFQQFFLQM